MTVTLLYKHSIIDATLLIYAKLSQHVHFMYNFRYQKNKISAEYDIKKNNITYFVNISIISYSLRGDKRCRDYGSVFKVL